MDHGQTWNFLTEPHVNKQSAKLAATPPPFPPKKKQGPAGWRNACPAVGPAAPQRKLLLMVWKIDPETTKLGYVGCISHLILEGSGLGGSGLGGGWGRSLRCVRQVVRKPGHNPLNGDVKPWLSWVVTMVIKLLPTY